LEHQDLHQGDGLLVEEKVAVTLLAKEDLVAVVDLPQWLVIPLSFGMAVYLTQAAEVVAEVMMVDLEL
jgi:hypothetical protein